MIPPNRPVGGVAQRSSAPEGRGGERGPKIARRPARSARSCRHGSGSRGLLSRHLHPGRALRRAAVHRGEDDGHLLPAGLSGAHAQARAPQLLSVGRGGSGGGLPAVPAVPARDRPRPGRVARHVEHRVARPVADREGWAGWRRRGGPRRACGSGGAAAPPALSPPSRRVADRGRTDAARPPGQAADPRDEAADDGGRAGGGLRQHPPVQRDLPAALRPPAEHASPRRRARGLVETERWRSCFAIGRRTTGRRCWPF